jgi:hypothetical protein
MGITASLFHIAKIEFFITAIQLYNATNKISITASRSWLIAISRRITVSAFRATSGSVGETALRRRLARAA